MPLYEYECEACAHRFERIQKYSDPPIETCPKCGSKVRKLFSSPAIQFKGSGFYITDYPKGDKGSAPKSDGGKSDKAAKADKPASTESSAKSEKSGASSDSKSSDSSSSDSTSSAAKTETKSDSKAESKT